MNSFAELFDLLGALARRRFRFAEQHFASLGLNHTEARLLTVLDGENGEASQDHLSNALHVDRSNAGRALKRLEQEGQIVRRSHDSDKRTNVVQLTAKGRRAVASIAKLREEMAQTFFGALSEEDAALTVQLLNKALKDEDDSTTARQGRRTTRRRGG